MEKITLKSQVQKNQEGQRNQKVKKMISLLNMGPTARQDLNLNQLKKDLSQATKDHQRNKNCSKKKRESKRRNKKNKDRIK